MSLDWTQILVTLITVALAGGIGSFFTFKLSNRKESSNEFKFLIEEHKKLRDKEVEKLEKVTERLDALENKNKNLLIEIEKLKNKLIIFEGSHTDIPLASWLKDTNGNMIFLNAEYENFFLTCRGYTINDYIGKDDFSVWDEETALEFTKHDKSVMRTKKGHRFIETADLSGTKYWLEVFKYPRFYNKKVIGIGGLLLRYSEKELNLDY